ncbi:Uu.00g064480.m01.CDS01 [Anthostomella pinea]|uniref:Uu.00g064480.m01.CDS01 n=1 Tax=Anthostomella pinea TaxID=933095 RepID=A0AAI8VTL1_9PEZI|nr:Uu.00g064480.m01.CDS01 [Anthostomella pinea]
MLSSILTYLPPLVLAIFEARRGSQQTFFKFTQSGAWVENLAVRSNGDLLVTRFDAPELWSINTSTKEATKVVAFDGDLQTSGITEIADDVFAVITGNFSMATGTTVGSWGVQKVDFTTGSNTPEVSTIKTMPEAEFLNGLTVLDEDTLLVGDMQRGLIYRLTISTGEYGIAVQDASMAPVADAPIAAGVDGLRYHDGFVYFTNIFGKTLNRIPLDTTDKATAGVVGSVWGLAEYSLGAIENIWQGTSADDLTFGADGSMYVATNSDNGVVRITADGKRKEIASVTGSTSCVFGRTEADRDVLYVAGSDGAITSIRISS